LIAGETETDRESYFESLTYAFNYGLVPLRGLYHEGHKLVSLPIPELYDLVADPDETRNLATDRAGTVREMATRLSELVAAEVGSTNRTVPIDETTRERLESLGYLSSANRLPSLEEYGPADDPKNWVHLANMLDEAVAHHRARRPAEAMQLLRAIIAEKADVAIAHTRLARILHEEGRSLEAIEVLEEALARGIDNVNVVTALGALLREKGDEAGWSRVLEEVVARSPDDADAHEALAASLMRQDLPGRAVPHLERFVELEPEQYDALVELGLVLAELGRESEARHYLERFVTTAPDETYREEKEQVRAFMDALGSR
jgi:tetratricopeptide (TPR) repeat protein